MTKCACKNRKKKKKKASPCGPHTDTGRSLSLYRLWRNNASVVGASILVWTTKGGEQDSRLPCTVLVTAWIKSLPVGQNSSGQAMTHGDYLMQTQTTEHRTSTVISTLLLAQLPPAVAVLVFSVCLFFSKTGSRRYTDLSNRVLKQREKTRL